MTQPTHATTTGLGLPLQSDVYGLPPLHIPDETGRIYKTELVVFRSSERTVKINWWHAPDIRTPHSHPWPFRSTILAGGYSETRYWIERCDQTHGYRVCSKNFTYRAGDVNDFPTRLVHVASLHTEWARLFHTVDQVEPGTVTRMEIGAVSVDPGDWGYLDVHSCTYERAKPDPEFRARLDAANRFRLPNQGAVG